MCFKKGVCYSHCIFFYRNKSKDRNRTKEIKQEVDPEPTNDELNADLKPIREYNENSICDNSKNVSSYRVEMKTEPSFLAMPGSQSLCDMPSNMSIQDSVDVDIRHVFCHQNVNSEIYESSNPAHS